MNPRFVSRAPLVTLAAALLIPASTAAAALSHCARSGDFCTSVAKVNATRHIAMQTFSHKGLIRVCVGNGLGFDCRPFELRVVGDSGLRSFSVRWARHFPDLGRGVYRISFDQGGRRIGPVLSFRRK